MVYLREFNWAEIEHERKEKEKFKKIQDEIKIANPVAINNFN